MGWFRGPLELGAGGSGVATRRGEAVWNFIPWAECHTATVIMSLRDRGILEWCLAVNADA